MSVYDLKTSVSELASSNGGVARMEYQQLPPTRDITNNNFPNGAIHFRWQMSGLKRWQPSKSYMRVRCQLGKADGTQLDLSDGIAPNMGLCASLFQSMEFRINDKTVSRVSDFVPQIDALETRLTKSKAWLDSIGASLNFWQPDFKERQLTVASDSSNEIKSEVVVQGVDLPGFDATTTIAISADTGLLTFGATVPAALPFVVGDEIEIDTAAGSYRLGVAAVDNGANQLKISEAKTVAVAAGVIPFRRIRTSISHEDNARKMNYIELVWQPPLSIFKVNEALPSGKYELVLNPQTASVYQKAAIESLVDKVANVGTVGAPSAGSNFIFNITDMYMYLHTLEGPREDDITYLLDLAQTRCQTDKIDSVSFQQKNFDVSPSTYGLTVAYQDLRSGNQSNVSASKFKTFNAAVDASEELKLTRFYINYAGQNLPAPDADPEFVEGKDWTAQRYTETQLYSGAYFDTGGAESIEEWQERGAYYHFKWPRDGTDRSTRVTVHQQFATGADMTNTRVLLFDHSRQVASVQVKAGRVVDVRVEDQ
jgi:hypothetical protein